ncbi:MAG: glycosyltransferase family 39 protein [Planctomycetes bacterium]|nr:glycosyltransferase family 39 protein [Planctomycetota bacterium]
MLIVLAALLVVPAVRQSVTVDEFAHVPAGISTFEDGRFDLYSKNPPLVRALTALPVLASGPEWKSLEFPEGKGNAWRPWTVGTRFFYDNVSRYDLLFRRARYVIVGLTIALAWLLHRYCKRTFGEWSALVTLALFAFCPTVLAHGSLATVDMGAALFALAAVVAFRAFVLGPSFRTSVLAGVSFGFALLAKFSALVLIPAFVLLWVGVRVRDRQRPTRREVLLGALAVVVVLVVVNAGYAFHGSLSRLDALEFESASGKSLQAHGPGWLPVPLPRDFVLGLDEQQADVEAGEFSNYLRGTWSATGWWWYFLYAILVKWTIPLLLLVVARVVSWPKFDREDAFLLVPAAAYFVVVSLGSHLQVGLRYLLPAFPLVFACVGRLASAPIARVRGVAIAMALLVMAHATSSVLAAPRYLSYFNAIGGGSQNGWRQLLDSNLDWGQELFLLRDWLAARGNPPVKLAYFGHVDPREYGIVFDLPEEAAPPHHGLYAVSANFLMGYPYVLLHEGKLLNVPRDRFAWLRGYQPTSRVGDTFFVFEIP